MNKQSSRIVSLILILTLCLSSLTACGDKEKDKEIKAPVTKSANTSDAPSAKPSASKKSEEESSPNPTTDNGAPSGKDKKTGDKSTKNTTATAKKPIPTVPARPPEKSGLNNRPSAVENATSTSQLANIAPEQAANNSYDTDAEVKQVQPAALNPSEFTYIPYDQFSTHIPAVWSNFITTEKVIVDAQYMNEYLNYVCLPLKNSFYETNCHGYSVEYGYDQTGTRVYMVVDWVYYINKAQYTTCKNAAAQLINSTSGSTVERMKAIHDRICIDTVYKLNVDGAYNNLISHGSDCDGYTAAFQICMELMGIPCKAYTTSSHIFNCVQVGGKWYAVDATYDDQTDQCGFVYSRYFLAGSSMYASYPILVNLLSSTDYVCSRKLVVADDAKFRTFLGISADKSYTLNDDSSITVDGVGTYRIY